GGPAIALGQRMHRSGAAPVQIRSNSFFRNKASAISITDRTSHPHAPTQEILRTFPFASYELEYNEFKENIATETPVVGRPRSYGGAVYAELTDEQQIAFRSNI